MVCAGDAVERSCGDGDDLLALEGRGDLPGPADVVVGAVAEAVVVALGGHSHMTSALSGGEGVARMQTRILIGCVSETVTNFADVICELLSLAPREHEAGPRQRHGELRAALNLDGACKVQSGRMQTLICPFPH